jgi:ABC-type Fe3+-siderophore transport system permease subunit
MTALKRDSGFNKTPYIIVAALMGMALEASGAVLQGILRNPLQTPISWAAFQAVQHLPAFGLLFGLYIFSKFTIPLTAFRCLYHPAS